jgi:hypothetical protein
MTAFESVLYALDPPFFLFVSLVSQFETTGTFRTLDGPDFVSRRAPPPEEAEAARSAAAMLVESWLSLSLRVYPSPIVRPALSSPRKCTRNQASVAPNGLLTGREATTFAIPRVNDAPSLRKVPVHIASPPSLAPPPSRRFAPRHLPQHSLRSLGEEIAAVPPASGGTNHPTEAL